MNDHTRQHTAFCSRAAIVAMMMMMNASSDGAMAAPMQQPNKDRVPMEFQKAHKLPVTSTPVAEAFPINLQLLRSGYQFEAPLSMHGLEEPRRPRSTSERLREFHEKTLQAVAQAHSHSRRRAHTTHACRAAGHSVGSTAKTPTNVERHRKLHIPILEEGPEQPLTIVNESFITSGAQFMRPELKSGASGMGGFNRHAAAGDQNEALVHKSKHQRLEEFYEQMQKAAASK